MSNNKDTWKDDTPVVPLTEGYGFAFLRSSVFRSNTAAGDNGGVANLGENSSVWVQGGGNLFEGNKAFWDGAVFSSATSSVIDIDGGEFVENAGDAVSVEAMCRGRAGADTLSTRDLSCASRASGGMALDARLQLVNPENLPTPPSIVLATLKFDRYLLPWNLSVSPR